MNNVSRYSDLAETLKTNEGRNNLCLKDINGIKNLLCNGTVDADSLLLTFHLLRCLRNACVHSTKNQNLVIRSGILEVFNSLMDAVLSPDLPKDKEMTEILQKVKITSVQFLGNLVVQNKQSQDTVWKMAFPRLFFNLMSNLGVKEKDFLCMVVFNCVKSRDKLYASDDEFWFLVSVVEYCRECQHAEWGLLVLELIISSASFVSFFKELNDYSGLRSSMIDLLLINLTSENEESSTEIPEKNILFLCDEFSTKSICILRLATTLSSELEEEALLLLKILSVLCSATSMYEKYKNVRSNDKLLKTVVEILKQKQGVPREKRSSVPNDDPIVGFERDLVRVIANMMYKNQAMQDQVREIQGIETLLNACNIDDGNPYIMEWAIFAIKNLCEGNTKNQEYITGLEQQGLSSNTILQQNNLQARLENGKIKISNISV